jgi:hypothetical protein
MVGGAMSTLTRRVRGGLLLALPAIVGQLLIAVPHETGRAAGVYAAAAPASSQAVLVGAKIAQTTQPHDPAQCPTCQSAAHGRNALGTDPVAQALPLPPTPGTLWLVSDAIARASSLSTLTPRAPPA